MPETKTGLPTDGELAEIAACLWNCESSTTDPQFEALREVRARTPEWAMGKILDSAVAAPGRAAAYRRLAVRLREAATEAEQG